MYSVLLLLHSLFRWLVLISLLYSIYRAGRGYALKGNFTKTDNALRHWTATIAHIQLMIGMVLYFKSPLIQYFWSKQCDIPPGKELTFFSLLHVGLMLIAIVTITIGSALVKRMQEGRAAYKTIFIWYLVALLIIL